VPNGDCRHLRHRHLLTQPQHSLGLPTWVYIDRTWLSRAAEAPLRVWHRGRLDRFIHQWQSLAAYTTVSCFCTVSITYISEIIHR
jgi:hypothetical protein